MRVKCFAILLSFHIFSLSAVKTLSSTCLSLHSWNIQARCNKYFVFDCVSTSEECKASTCSSTLEMHNRASLHSLKKLITVFSKIDSHVRVLASASEYRGPVRGGPVTPYPFNSVNRYPLFQKVPGLL